MNEPDSIVTTSTVTTQNLKQGEDWKHPARWLPLLCLAIMWLMLLMPPICPTYLTLSGNEQLDYSWQYSNGYFLQHQMRAGVDYVFPTGLLAYFYAYFWGGIYIKALFWWYWLWQMASRSFFAYNLWRLCARYPDYRVRALIFVACGFVLATTDDVFYIALLLTISEVLSRPLAISQRRLALNVVVLALIACLKFTLFVYGGIIAVVMAWPYYASKRPMLFSPLAVFLASFALIWLALGQHPGDFPAYIKNSMAVSSGYSAAMAVQGDARAAFLGLLELCLIGVWLLKFRPPRNQTNICSLLIMGMFLLFLWKHGFVRNDPHGIFCFGSVLFFALVLPVSFQEEEPRPSQWGHAVLGVCVIASVIGYLLIWKSDGWRGQLRELAVRPRHGISYAFLPWKTKRRLDEDRALERKLWDLPAIKSIVKDKPIDVFSYDQYALLLNDFHYQPRPVYQGYVAFSPALIALNAVFYRGENAPAYVLFRLQTTDNRYPTLDDNQSLLEILSHYHPIETEKSYILFARNSAKTFPSANIPPNAAPSGESAGMASSGQAVMVVALNTDVEIKDQAVGHLLRVDVEPTVFGKVRSALVRPPQLNIIVTLEDGREMTYRVIPEMTTQGFLLDPLLESNRDVLLLYGHGQGKRTHKFRIEMASGARLWLQNRVKITLIPQAVVTPYRVDTVTLKRLMAPERLALPTP